MAGDPAPARPRSRAWLPLVLAFAAPWLVYVVLLALQPADRFDVWHGEVAWPAAHFMTASQGGLFMPIFAYVMAGGIGGLFLGMLLVGVARLLMFLRVPDLREPAARLGMILMPVWVFVVFKAVPVTVTAIDPEARQLEVSRFHWLLRVPRETIVIRGEELHGFDVTSYLYRRNGTRYLELFALMGGRAVKLAERPCEWEEEACLASADADVAELARWLGRPTARGSVTVGDGHRVLTLDPGVVGR